MNRLHLAASRPDQPAELGGELSDIFQTTVRAIAEVRAISAALLAPALDLLALTTALDWMVEQSREAFPIQFASELESIDGLLAANSEIQIYRIVQEALSNVIRHADASRGILETKRGPSGIRVSLYDNGCGFDPNSRLL